MRAGRVPRSQGNNETLPGRRLRMPTVRGLSVIVGVIAVMASAAPTAAQKAGGTLRSYIWDNPPSASIHEEATISTVFPFMPVFNNLVMYDQTKLESSLET